MQKSRLPNKDNWPWKDYALEGEEAPAVRRALKRRRAKRERRRGAEICTLARNAQVRQAGGRPDEEAHLEAHDRFLRLDFARHLSELEEGHAREQEAALKDYLDSLVDIGGEG